MIPHITGAASCVLYELALPWDGKYSPLADFETMPLTTPLAALQAKPA
jgi:hypothetical protein